MHGFFLLDDFGLLLLARFQDNPLAPFAADHMPGSVYYRPMGALLWWLSERLFGSDPHGHYLLNLALHLANGLALWAMIATASGRSLAGLLAAVVFLLHPVGMGTALWLADRFDLLACLFGLLAIRQSLLYLDRQRLRDALLTGVLLLLSLWSKEVGIAAVAAVGVLWLGMGATLGRRRQVMACLSLVALLAGFLCLRATILADPSADLLMRDTSLMARLGAGALSWAHGWFDYLLAWPQMATWQRGLLALGTLLFLPMVIAGAMGPWDRPRRRLAVIGLLLWLTPAVLQAPMTGLLSLGITADTGPVQMALDSRYFYLSQAGALSILVAIAMTDGARWRWTGMFGAAAVLVVALPLAAQSRALAGRYAGETDDQRTIVDAAVAAMGRLPLPADGCRVFLVDIDSWMFAWVADEAVKAMADSPDRIDACLIQTEHTPWYHVVPANRLDPSLTRPMIPAIDAGKTIPWPRMGSADVVYLNMPSTLDPDALSGAFVLSWHEEHFVDITDDVLSGRREIAFHCNRAPHQCGEQRD